MAFQRWQLLLLYNCQRSTRECDSISRRLVSLSLCLVVSLFWHHIVLYILKFRKAEAFSFLSSSGWCSPEQISLDEMCSNIKSDDTLYSMFRVNSKPIPCPFSGTSFTFTYDKGFGECATPISLGEKCTDESKLLLKYQACPDIERSESNSKLEQALSLFVDLFLSNIQDGPRNVCTVIISKICVARKNVILV